MKQNLLNEMMQDFTEDVTLAYQRAAARSGVCGSLPMKALQAATQRIATEFRRLSAVHRREFAEVLFRVAVVRSIPSPALCIVNPSYVLHIAMQEVAADYRPTNPPALALVA